ncbi:BCCT family transporter [Allostreptomyces psammosilenae]|uniref:Choline/carnitine/betaine transport n=1 Tax=Allostreptomyces psammosilenae TaxID=1892865 RepID=A0A853A205_9ACTN|nr:BCCT family transporter [Allostreptomyces psammosilenae]NYI07490.1 choline/carnitine/betaine transport [Allostreptomyces psammosilenae]
MTPQTPEPTPPDAPEPPAPPVHAPLTQDVTRLAGSGATPTGAAVDPSTTIPEASLPPDRIVFGIGALLVVAVVAWGVVSPESLNEISGTALAWTTHNFGWFFVLAADAFLALSLLLIVSRFGRVKLGADDDDPEFSTLAWASMMFSAGMGIGLMFWGVAEPLTHFAAPPPASGAEPGSGEAARAAMEYTLFHWTLHPWAIYAVAGLALAYATFRKGRGNSLSAAFDPILGRHARGAAGRAIDLLAVFATVFGSATSLGLGALQMARGLHLVADVPETQAVDLVIIGVLTAAFVVSAFSGVHRGVKWLSTINVYLAVAIMVFVFLLGPTVYILDVIPASIGSYLQDLISLSSGTGAFSSTEWLGNWTIFYWAWWLSWAPFVGTFIARISRGRTVRQFLLGVLLVPSGASAIWFGVMGGSALRLDATGQADLVGTLTGGPETALFSLLESLPLYGITAVISVVLVALYFVTGADSASLVLGSLSSRGSLHPRRPLVVVWGVLIGAVAAVLLVAGGLEGLQSATILVALPFVVVMLALCASLVRELGADPAAAVPRAHRTPHGLRAAIRAAVGEEIAAQRGGERARADTRARALRRISHRSRQDAGLGGPDRGGADRDGGPH